MLSEPPMTNTAASKGQTAAPNRHLRANHPAPPGGTILGFFIGEPPVDPFTPSPEPCPAGTGPH